MAFSLCPQIKFRYESNNNEGLSGGKVYTYTAGSTDPTATYTDITGGVENANPVILDSRGEANIWLDDSISYKFVIKDSSDNIIDTIDNITGAGGVDSGAGKFKLSGTDTVANYFLSKVSAGAGISFSVVTGGSGDVLTIASTVTEPPATRTIFVTNAGSDSDDGLTVTDPVLTLSQAITNASALTPTNSSPVGIVCNDASVFSESISLPAYTFIVAPQATFIGTIDLSANASWTAQTPYGVMFKILKATTGNLINRGSGSGTCVVRADEIYTSDAVGIYHAASSDLIVSFDKMHFSKTTSGYGVLNYSSNGKVILTGGKIYGNANLTSVFYKSGNNEIVVDCAEIVATGSYLIEAVNANNSVTSKATFKCGRIFTEGGVDISDSTSITVTADEYLNSVSDVELSGSATCNGLVYILATRARGMVNPIIDTTGASATAKVTIIDNDGQIGLNEDNYSIERTVDIDDLNVNNILNIDTLNDKSGSGINITSDIVVSGLADATQFRSGVANTNKVDFGRTNSATNYKFAVWNSGKLWWGAGDGVTSEDASIERTGAGVLELTDTLNVTSTITSKHIYSPTYIASTVDIDWDNGITQFLSLSTGGTFTFANGNSGEAYTLVIDATGGAQTYTWPASVDWLGAPFTGPSGNGVYLVQFRLIGSAYYGSWSNNSDSGSLTVTDLSVSGTESVNTIQAYSGATVTFEDDVALGTGYDLTMSATGTIFTDTIDDVSGGQIAFNSDMKISGDIVRDVLTDRFDLCGGTSVSVAHGGSVRIEGNNFGGVGLGGDVMIYSGNTTTGNVSILTGPSSASAMQFLADQTCKVDGKFRITNSYTPASSSETVSSGVFYWDATYLYCATATNTIKRIAWTTF